MTWIIVALISIIGGALSIRSERRYRALQRKLDERRDTVTVTWVHPVNVAAKRSDLDALYREIAREVPRASTYTSGGA